jgi:hypothetical protein
MSLVMDTRLVIMDSIEKFADTAKNFKYSSSIVSSSSGGKLARDENMLSDFVMFSIIQNREDLKNISKAFLSIHTIREIDQVREMMMEVKAKSVRS